MKMFNTKFISKFLIISLTISIIFSALCLPLSAEADEEEAVVGNLTISEDYRNATFNGKIYVLIDGDCIIWETEKNIPEKNIILSEAQENVIFYKYAYFSNMFLSIDLSFTDGGSCCYNYIDTQYFDEYTAFVRGTGEEYFINSTRNNEHIAFDVDLNCTAANKKVIKGYELNYMSCLTIVYTSAQNGCFEKSYGSIYSDASNNYFYVNHYQFGESDGRYFDPAMHDEITIYKLSDTNLISRIEQEYGNNKPIMPDDEEAPAFLSIVSAMIFCILFGLLPLAGMILCIIFASKSKQPYKKGMLVAALLLALEVAVFSTVVLLLILL